MAEPSPAVVALNKQEPHSGASHLIPSPIPHIENDNCLPGTIGCWQFPLTWKVIDMLRTMLHSSKLRPIVMVFSAWNPLGVRNPHPRQ
ncbi:hypothetical protein EMCRGX_G009873 [Ephydatia muelleri]